jgi:hypothetical protein
MSVFWIWFVILIVIYGISSFTYGIYLVRTKIGDAISAHLLLHPIKDNLHITNKSIEEMLSYLYVGNYICLIILFLLTVQIMCKFHLKDDIRLNFFVIFGTKINNKLEYYLNKIVSFNRKTTTIYIWLLVLILIVTLTYSAYISNDLYTNLDNYIYTYNTMKDCEDAFNSIRK